MRFRQIRSAAARNDGAHTWPQFGSRDKDSSGTGAGTEACRRNCKRALQPLSVDGNFDAKRPAKRRFLGIVGQ
jgi:phage/plasmid primase-like uncharacterized protein